MNTSIATGSDILESETPLLDDVVHSSVDFKCRPAIRSKSGYWKSASFIIGVEMAERFAYYGISANLVSYFTGPLGQSTATAAANVNAWSGTAFLTPLLGAVVADSFLGRYRTIIIASLFYILGLGLLTLSAAIHHFNSSNCESGVNNMACSPPQLQIIFFFLSLYLVAIAQGGHKPCLQAFGADQFDENDQRECKAKSSFFNWWTFFLCASALLGNLVLSYIEDNLSWELGFGIPCIVMFFALIIFLLGSMTYRFRISTDQRNPYIRIGRVFLNASRNRRVGHKVTSIEEEEAQQNLIPHEDAHFGRFLDKALLEANDPKEDKTENDCSADDVEDAKAIIRLLPIWLTCLMYAVVYSQTTTLFTKQGVIMDRYITTRIQIPAAAFQSLTSASLVLFIPLYDQVIVPIARSITHKPSGISMLQRIGTGMCLSVISMIIAALVETNRIATAVESGLIDSPNATVPMSVWWLAPQYLVLGLGDVFTLVGLQEFLYDQVPSDLKSMGLALCFGVVGSGSFLSSFLVSFIDWATSTGPGHEGSWFSDNLNRAHLDYFYWLLAGISAFSFVAFVYFAKSYVYYNGRTVV